MVTAREVAGGLWMPNPTLYDLRQRGQLPATKAGRHRRFDYTVSHEWFRRRTSEGQNGLAGDRRIILLCTESPRKW